MKVAIGGIGFENRAPGTGAGLVLARGCKVGPSDPGLLAELDRAIAKAAARTDTETITKAVRDLLRHGKYKPTGRGKPASEYLLNAAKESRFPKINNLVDINNLVSLESLLPISVIDLKRAGEGGFVLRRGKSGEAYVFNAGGQTIELEDLLLVARAGDDAPLANPVKDSMASKLDEHASDVLAVLYAPMNTGLEAATASFADAVRRFAGPSLVESALVYSE
jgi:DNA/RNA-binding domain of Phe-tRNA-synthetase-like protein